MPHALKFKLKRREKVVRSGHFVREQPKPQKTVPDHGLMECFYPATSDIRLPFSLPDDRGQASA